MPAECGGAKPKGYAPFGLAAFAGLVSLGWEGVAHRCADTPGDRVTGIFVKASGHVGGGAVADPEPLQRVVHLRYGRPVEILESHIIGLFPLPQLTALAVSVMMDIVIRLWP